MRFARCSLILVALVLSAASSAHAETTYTASTSVDSGNPLSALVPGDVVTIDITVRTDGETTYAIEASAYGYDPAIAQYQTGTVVGDLLASACIVAFGCVDALPNLQDSPPPERFSPPLGPDVRFVQAVSLAAGGGNGSADIGVSGVIGDPQFRLVFAAGTLGSTTITLGSDPLYGGASVGDGGAILVTNSASVTLNVIPEPGTALLMGLGLAGLACVRRR